MIDNRLSAIMGRERVNISELARRAGCSRGTVSKLYHEQTRQLDMDVLDRLCEVMGMQPGDILVYVPSESAEKEGE